MASTSEKMIEGLHYVSTAAEQLSDHNELDPSLHELPDNIRAQVIQVFARGFSLQMKITTVFAAL